MRQGKRAALALCLCGALPVVWLGLAIAPAAPGGLPAILARFTEVMNRPAHIELCEDSLKTVLILLLIYGLGIGVYFSSRRNYRRGEEHGSAKWGDARAVNKKYQAKEAPEKFEYDGRGRQRRGKDPLLCQAQCALTGGVNTTISK